MNWKCFFLGHEIERIPAKTSDGFPYWYDTCKRCNDAMKFTLHGTGRIG